MSNPNKFWTVKQFNEIYPNFSLGMLRALIFHSEENGFSSVIVRISANRKRGKILINEDAFFAWLHNQQGRMA